MITVPSNFKGLYSIPKNGNDMNQAKIVLDIIADSEPRILTDLFGSVMYAELKDSALDGGSNPPSTELQFIFDPFAVNIYNSYEIRSNGITVMLAQMIYNDIMTTLAIQSTSFGDRISNSENSDNRNLVVKCAGNFNEGIKSYWAIQEYIRRNKDSYPNYIGRNKDLKSIF